MLYQAYQAHRDLMDPMRALARCAHRLLSNPRHAWAPPLHFPRTAAALRVFASTGLGFSRPAFGIDQVLSEGREYPVREAQVLRTPFATLLHFHKEGAPEQPKVLLVAPMSGHFSTLLRETVRTLLGDHDVFITDWHNAREVPLAEGRFDLDAYTAHLIQFMAQLGPDAHMIAVCQPCVAALAATAVMAQDDHPCQPRSLILMAGPIDCRVSPTEVNRLATSKPIEWFERNLIHVVPARYPGALRLVYPGFVQLSAFMSMNLERHMNSFREMYENLVAGHHDKAEQTRRFYEEYFAVADLPAEFYLETVKKVFQDYALPRGTLRFQGRSVEPAAIRRTALLTVEGERDDICAVGQTMAAQDLCSNVRPYRRRHHVQTGVGHYGVFSGRRWNHEIYPIVRDVIYACH